ncbi:MAG: hypothetical protein WA972_21065 [Rhodococcus qingshengii]
MFNHPAFWPTAGTVIVAAITALVGWLTGRRSDRVNLLEQQRKDFEVILGPMREEIAELRGEVNVLKRTDRDRDGLIDDLLSWARSTIRWIEDKLPGTERPQLSQRAWDHVSRDGQS